MEPDALPPSVVEKPPVDAANAEVPAIIATAAAIAVSEKRADFRAQVELVVVNISKLLGWHVGFIKLLGLLICAGPSWGVAQEVIGRAQNE